MWRRNERYETQNGPKNQWYTNPVNGFVGVVLMAFSIFSEKLVDFSHGNSFND